MIQLPRKLFYAIEAALYIAYNASTDPISGKEIANRQGLPSRYLEQMMQRLVHAGILRGVRGPHGGYLLAREKRRISLAEICKAIHEEDNIPSSTPLGKQIIAPLARRLHDLVEGELQKTTLADLHEQAAQLHIKKTAAEKNDFTI